MNKNTGFVKPKIRKDHYVLGGGMLPEEILQPDGNWSNFLPDFEPQNKKFETYNCTGFNTLNAIETILRRLGIEENYSDRWLGIIAGTKYPGNDPHIVAEAIRKYGLIPESMLPFTEDLESIDEYYSFKGGDREACYKAGQEWLERFDFGHEWVFNGGKDKQEKMIEALKCSPLGVSVYAWKKRNGLYIKPKGGEDNHWTLNIVGVKEKEYWLIDDSYLDDGNSLKYLDWNYDFGFCKRYSIKIKEPKKSLKEKIISLMIQALSLIQIDLNNMEELKWDTKENARHSARVIMDEYKLRWAEKDLLCACIEQESGFNPKARGKPNRDGTSDFGLCQYNNGKNKAGVPYWIGPGADFADVEEVLNDPEKNVRIMVREYKKGNLKWWSSYSTGAYKKWL